MDLIFAGVVVSLLVEWLKRIFGTSRLQTISICAILSILGGVGYAVLSHYGVWEQAVSIFVTAGAFYTFIIKSIKA